LQARHGKIVHEENISTWRRTIAGDLTSIFRRYDPRESQLTFLNRDKFVVSIEKARYKEIPSNYRNLTNEQIDQINRMPMRTGITAHQEKGVRPACALPYELYADGNVTEDGAHWELRLTAGNQIQGSISVGAPFNVYLRHLKAGHGFQAATFVVKAGDTLTRRFSLDQFADEKYSIEVYGPNGFYRAFTGHVASRPAINVRATHELNAFGSTGNLQIHLDNVSGNSVSVAIADQSYGASVVHKEVLRGEET